MRKVTISAMIIAVLAACGGQKLPAGVLDKERMELVLTDVILAEAFAESYLSADTSKRLKQLYTQELDKVLAIHKVSPKDFQASIQYYKSQPEQFKVVIDTVNARAMRAKDLIFKQAMDKKPK
ncbi:MAG: DUF4296 domain-containing protein [Chitinophagaceae bacterium]